MKTNKLSQKVTDILVNTNVIYDCVNVAFEEKDREAPSLSSH